MKKVQDHYFKRAKREGFAARSVYKLEEIERRQRLLAPGQRVLDLGCAPGSWLQYAARRVGPSGSVLGLDLEAVAVSLPAQAQARVGDAFALDAAALLAEGGPFDVILSDMAPRTSGIRSADAARSAQLVEQTLALAATLLRPGGTLLVKVFQGAQMEALRADFRRAFARVHIVKPRASRSESVEVYLLGEEKRAEAASEAP
jgi:23S rRNA (uridine2552-2'-O)-methyltransferase